MVDDKPPNEIARLEDFMLLDDYLEEKQQEIEAWNRNLEAKGAKPVNGRRITNIGTFRIYVEKYLKSLKTINQQMTILVRKNYQSRPIIEAFAADPQMPPIVSDEAFLLSSCLPVCLLIHALRLLENADDRVSTEFLRLHDLDINWLAEQRERLRLQFNIPDRLKACGSDRKRTLRHGGECCRVHE